MSEIKRLTRNYEISVWTLQDGFITVLGASNDKYRGRIQNPEMTLVNDGTQELNFSIPMYLDNGIIRDLNPVWQDINNAAVIAGMRKIKVIFNKTTDVKQVFEFLITKVTKTHENDRPWCDVHCEGLAFHELGKVGYKIEFSTDVLTEASYQWSKKRPKYYIGTAPENTGVENENDDEVEHIQYFETEGEWRAAEAAWAATEPLSTLDYWVHDVMGIEKYPETGIPNSTTWYYKVEMDWSGYSHIGDVERETDKVYDEEYVTSWTTELLPKDADSIQSYKEKTRILDEKESNIYNLTQKLAETFGIFCRYDYGYDDNYHINSRTIVFYNNAINDRTRNFSFTYPYSSTKITREDDSTDLVTKMYVTAVEDSSTESGLVTIMTSNANPTREDYVMNFDYLHDINTISDEQYAAIHDFEVAIRAKNDELQPLNDKLLVKQDRLPKIEALRTIAKDAMVLDTERRDNCKRLRDALDETDGAGDGYITVEGADAELAVLLKYPEQEGTYYIREVPKNGILPSSFKLYKDINRQTGMPINQIRSGRAEYDSFGNLISWVLVDESELITGGTVDTKVYLTYKYSLANYYKKVEDAWNKRLEKDETDYKKYQDEIYKVDEATGIESGLKIEIENLKEQIQTIVDEKAQLIKEFENMMGPALREGFWTPENYDTRTGEKFTDFIQIDSKLKPIENSNEDYLGNTEYASFVWDTKLFEDEQDIYYEQGIEQQKVYYPFVELTNEQWNFIRQHPDDPVGIIYYDYLHTDVQHHEEKYLKCLAIGASAQLAFINRNNTIVFGLLITGPELTSEEMSYLKTYAKGAASIGYLTTEIINDELQITSVSGGAINDNQWIQLNSSNHIVYPRIKINSLALKHTETDLMISYNYKELKEYEDYYVLSRVDTNEEETEYLGSSYYITIKPSVLVYADTINSVLPLKGYIGIRYSISNASTAVYLDSLEVIKENSKPKVTYTLDPNILQENFTYTAYNALNTIAFINDHELQFDGAQGYISTLNLNLDFPNEDTLEIKNYKNKFEDLFSTIVAQTQAMEKNEATIMAMTKIIGTDGSISAPALTGALRKVDLNYAFNNGKLTISEANGIWGTSDDGVVAFRGGGIFTATQKDEAGSWIWNTGIVPQGINANLITVGQLDTNKITVYSGDKIRFQLNDKGLIAYKSLFSDYDVKSTNPISATEYNSLLQSNKTGDADLAQYVIMNEDGLFLIAKKGSYIVYNNNGVKDIKILGDGDANFPDKLKRVEISWDGLKLRNYNNDLVFYADADTGNLTVSGTIKATGLYIQQGNDMQQVQFSVDPTSHHINLSSTNFDNNGIKSSKVEIVPDGIIIKSNGTLNLSGAQVTLSANQIQGMPNMNNYYSKQGAVNIHSTGVDITGGRVYIGTYDYNNINNVNNSYVLISNNEIRLKAGSIYVKGAPIWERNDIIYDTLDPRRSGAPISPPSGRAWLWVQPLGQSSATYTMTNSSTLTAGAPLNNPSSGAAITYTVTIVAWKETTDALNNIGFDFSAGSLAFPTILVNFPGGQGKTTISNVVATTTNICTTNSISYTWSDTGSYTTHIDSITLRAVAPTDASSSGSECRVYYYSG